MRTTVDIGEEYLNQLSSIVLRELYAGILNEMNELFCIRISLEEWVIEFHTFPYIYI